MCTFKNVSHLFTLLLLMFMVQTVHAAPALISTQQTRLQKLGPPGGKRNADWILDFYGDDAYLNEDDKKAFVKNLDHLVVGDIRSDCPGDYSKGIYSLLKDYEVGGVNYGKDKVLIKVVGGMENPKSTVDDKSWGEVKALKDVGPYIDSGMANVDHGNYPVIVMKMVEGVRIQDTIAYKYARPDQKLELLEEAKPHVRKEVVHFAVEKGILHVQIGDTLEFSKSRKVLQKPKSGDVLYCINVKAESACVNLLFDTFYESIPSLFAFIQVIRDSTQRLEENHSPQLLPAIERKKLTYTAFDSFLIPFLHRISSKGIILLNLHIPTLHHGYLYTIHPWPHRSPFPILTKPILPPNVPGLPSYAMISAQKCVQR
ncbi:hypothetical protein EV368DRAFT_61620 [Lentinula lateritia]|uniref:Uncharacterized protein n=1 Tax=Lentinula aff. lateritia TaxID=2804960 RepID=A0ACC1UAG5_9AGAR|nr:hypothetical protein F5876DRAFT_62619 [Lentinula aff. lateritia]KAJ3856477.1 hypothetical protein EV368DRAFT_61620 [Lentinula lateritia]